MKIAAIETCPVRITLKPDHRMVSALGRHDESRFLLLRLRTDDGVEGAGEASITVRWSGETVWGAEALVRNVVAPLVVGQPLDVDRPLESIAAIDRRMDQAIVGNWFAKSAVEMACWDALGKAADRPVYELLGGACRALEIRSRFSMGAYEVPRAQARAEQLVAEGFDTVKVKVGGEPEADIARVRAVREVIGMDRKLVIDANGGWTVDAAIATIRRLADVRIDLAEQPTPRGDFSGIARVRRETSVRVMADDMCFDLADARELLRQDAVDLISVYPGKNGGIRKSREIVELAAEHGVACTIGSNLEFDIATAAMGHLAVATPNVRIDEWPGDIHGPEYYETRIVRNPLRIAGPVTVLNRGAGLGVEVDWPLVERLAS